MEKNVEFEPLLEMCLFSEVIANLDNFNLQDLELISKALGKKIRQLKAKDKKVARVFLVDGVVVSRDKYNKTHYEIEFVSEASEENNYTKKGTRLWTRYYGKEIPEGTSVQLRFKEIFSCHEVFWLDRAKIKTIY